ncbi:MAG TPA: DUF4339 domain-containing protein [Pirellulales bacterium]|nr:DUF4339 domain-containing protein [Pirellulales bacterium]
MADWFYQVMGTEIGPVSSSELKEKAADGTITRETFIRGGCDGDWISAEKTSLSFGGRAEPVIDTSKSKMPRVNAAQTQDSPEKAGKPKGKMLAMAGLGIAACVLVALAAMFVRSAPEKPTKPSKPPQPDPKALFEQFLGDRAPNVEGQRFTHSRRETQVNGRRHQEIKELVVGKFRYDVRKTDSLVSPFVGEVQTFVEEIHSSYDEGRPIANATWVGFNGNMTLTYGFQDGRWTLTNASCKGKVGDLDEGVSFKAKDWAKMIGMDL